MEKMENRHIIRTCILLILKISHYWICLLNHLHWKKKHTKYPINSCFLKFNAMFLNFVLSFCPRISLCWTGFGSLIRRKNDNNIFLLSSACPSERTELSLHLHAQCVHSSVATLWNSVFRAVEIIPCMRRIFLVL